MYHILINDIDSERKKFVEIHATGDYYGGSDVANICGIGWDSPLKVWLRKTGKAKPATETPQMRLGKLCEPVIAELFREKTALNVYRPNQVWQSKERPWMIVSPDALIQADPQAALELGEFKTHKSYAEKFWGPNEASDSAQCQLQWGLAVSGLSGGYCVALIGGDTEKFFHPHFSADPQLQSQLIERVEQFREFVQKDIPPAAGPGDADAIRELLVQSVDGDREVDLTAEHACTLAELKKWTELLAALMPDVKRAEDAIKGLKNTLVVAGNGAGRITIGDASVSVKKVVVAPFMNRGCEYFKVTVR